MISRLSKVKVTLYLLLAFGAIFALSSCGGNKSEREYTEGNILSIECIEGSGITMDADFMYKPWEYMVYHGEPYYYRILRNDKHPMGDIVYSSGDSSATVTKFCYYKDITLRFEIDGCPVDKIISAYAESYGEPLDIDINDYILFKNGNIRFIFPKYDDGHEIYLTVASTANHKTASFVMEFAYGG